MSKYVIEPNKIYLVYDGSSVFFIRVIERWFSDYKVEIAPYSDSGDFSVSDLNFEPAIYTRFELMHLFGSFDFDSESDEEDIDDEEA